MKYFVFFNKVRIYLFIIASYILFASCSLNEYISPPNIDIDENYGFSSNINYKIEKKVFDLGEFYISGNKKVSYINYYIKIGLNSSSERISKVQFKNKSTQKIDFEIVFIGNNTGTEFIERGQYNTNENIRQNINNRNYSLMFVSSQRQNIYAEM